MESEGPPDPSPAAGFSDHDSSTVDFDFNPDAPDGVDTVTLFTSSMNRVGLESAFRWMMTRSIGMEAAMIAVAGSAVPKIWRSTVVALGEERHR
jgi:hypothetical protein